MGKKENKETVGGRSESLKDFYKGIKWELDSELLGEKDLGMIDKYIKSQVMAEGRMYAALRSILAIRGIYNNLFMKDYLIEAFEKLYYNYNPEIDVLPEQYVINNARWLSQDYHKKDRGRISRDNVYISNIDTELAYFKMYNDDLKHSRKMPDYIKLGTKIQFDENVHFQYVASTTDYDSIPEIIRGADINNEEKLTMLSIIYQGYSVNDYAKKYKLSQAVASRKMQAVKDKLQSIIVEY